jgi:hypothetical protein
METTLPISNREEKLIRIVRRLPPERVTQVIDFAEFLEFQTGEFESNENDAHWDALLASGSSQQFLEKLADEALAEIEGGQATQIVFTSDGEIAPK